MYQSSYHLSPHENGGADERYSYSNNRGPSNSYYDEDAWNATPGDDDAFLMSNKNASATNLSPEVFARERYINRMEANEKAAAAGGAYDQGVPSYRAKNGLFAGKKKWWWIAGALLVVAIIAVAVGIAVSKSNKKDSATGAVKSDKNDPSNFEKDPNLHQSFYAMCYTPQDAQVCCPLR